MLVIGGDINVGIEGIGDIFDRRDEAALISLARRQVEFGASAVGINLAGRGDEVADLLWASKIIQAACSVPLAFDCPDLEHIEAGLSVYEEKWGAAVLNSTTAEAAKLKASCRLAADRGMILIALPTTGVGLEKSGDQFLELSGRIVDAALSAGLTPSRLYIDPMLKPVAVSDLSGCQFLDRLHIVRKAFPEVGTICGIDNISHGLPARALLSSMFLAMAMAEGLSGVIMRSGELHYGALRAGAALLGCDQFCSTYIASWRSGAWDNIVRIE
ncbi:dihydropteroate synthase [Sediminispirochaeta smaragdinae]|uniref:Dihydropteroate synthase DHPS n=1 Tax=Sediminispirochaeta smaragdinae (strain DSM 11293 / JCM 15392 / SEBR 4228) TaxID=573413 RepID=E1R263_SEDSS|nr:dihydropteroate synthase [Sediminispirochaeta smaragdinae]ADK81948.1 dihydropteroate synthase DHPS [Sediminispirochaeta smaragdinae DSM 11293]